MKFEITSFRGGKSDYTDRGLAGSFQSSKNLNIRDDEDVLQCNQALVADGNANSIVVDLIRFFVLSSNGNLYGFGDTGKIYERTPSAVWSVVYTDADGAITGAYEFPLSNGNYYLWWATATKLKQKLITGGTNWTTDVNATVLGQTYPKTNLNSASWHTMTNADGALMICNKNYLAMIGYDGSWTNEAVNLRPGTISKAIIEYGRDALSGGGNEVDESHLFTWNVQALSWIDKNRIPEKQINAIVRAENLYAQAGDNGLYFSNMSEMMPICILDGKANPGGVVGVGGTALFGLYGGSYSGIWSYGRKKKNENNVLNLEYYIDCDEIGALAEVGGLTFVAYKDGANYYVKKEDSANKASAEYVSLTLTMPKESTVQNISLVTDEIPTGCSIAVYYQLDGGGWLQAKMAGDVATATAGDRDPIFLVGSYGRVLEVKIQLTPNSNDTPKVGEIYVNFI